MKTLSILPLSLLLAACVTSADIRAVADAQAKYEQKTVEALEKISDQTATKDDVAEAKEEVREASKEFAEAVEAVAEAVEQRTSDTLTGLPESAEGGLVGILAALALNYYRSQTRKKDLAVVEEKVKHPSA